MDIEIKSDNRYEIADLQIGSTFYWFRGRFDKDFNPLDTKVMAFSDDLVQWVDCTEPDNWKSLVKSSLSAHFRIIWEARNRLPTQSIQVFIQA